MLGHDTGSGEEDGVPRVCRVGYIPGWCTPPTMVGRHIYRVYTSPTLGILLCTTLGIPPVYHPVYITCIPPWVYHLYTTLGIPLCTPLLYTLCIPPCVHHCYTPGYTSVFGRKRHNEACLIPPSLGEIGTMRRVLSSVFGRERGEMRRVLSAFFGRIGGIMRRREPPFLPVLSRFGQKVLVIPVWFMPVLGLFAIGRGSLLRIITRFTVGLGLSPF